MDTNKQSIIQQSELELIITSNQGNIGNLENSLAAYGIELERARKGIIFKIEQINRRRHMQPADTDILQGQVLQIYPNKFNAQGSASVHSMMKVAGKLAKTRDYVKILQVYTSIRDDSGVMFLEKIRNLTQHEQISFYAFFFSISSSLSINRFKEIITLGKQDFLDVLDKKMLECIECRCMNTAVELVKCYKAIDKINWGIKKVLMQSSILNKICVFKQAKGLDVIDIDFYSLRESGIFRMLIDLENVLQLEIEFYGEMFNYSDYFKESFCKEIYISFLKPNIESFVTLLCVVERQILLEKIYEWLENVVVGNGVHIFTECKRMILEKLKFDFSIYAFEFKFIEYACSMDRTASGIQIISLGRDIGTNYHNPCEIMLNLINFKESVNRRCALLGYRDNERYELKMHFEKSLLNLFYKIEQKFSGNDILDLVKSLIISYSVVNRYHTASIKETFDIEEVKTYIESHINNAVNDGLSLAFSDIRIDFKNVTSNEGSLESFFDSLKQNIQCLINRHEQIFSKCVVVELFNSFISSLFEYIIEVVMKRKMSRSQILILSSGLRDVYCVLKYYISRALESRLDNYVDLTEYFAGVRADQNPAEALYKYLGKEKIVKTKAYFDTS